MTEIQTIPSDHIATHEWMDDVGDCLWVTMPCPACTSGAMIYQGVLSDEYRQALHKCTNWFCGFVCWIGDHRYPETREKKG